MFKIPPIHSRIIDPLIKEMNKGRKLLKEL